MFKKRNVAIINEETGEVKGYDKIYPAVKIINRFIVAVDYKWGIIDEKGNELCDIKYEDAILPYHYEGFYKVKYGGKYGFINTDGKEIGSIKYDSVASFNNGFAVVELNGKIGFIDKKGKEICEITFDEVNEFDKNKTASVKKNGKWGIIDSNGNIVCNFKYDEITYFNNGLWLVKDSNDLYSIINENFEEVIPFNKYKSIYYSYPPSSLMKVFDGIHYGFINKSGQEVIPTIYDYFFDTGDAKPIIAEKGVKWGIISRDGRVLVDFKYDHIGLFDGYGFATLIENRNTMDMKGNYEHIEWADVNGNIYAIKPKSAK